MAQEKIEVVIVAKDLATKTLNEVGAAMSRVGNTARTALSKGLNFVKENFRAAGLAAGAFLASLVAVGKKMLSIASDFEQNAIAFTTMIGNAELAKEKLEELTDFAARTPFEIPEVFEGARGLLAFGIAADDLIPILKMLGDVSAGLNVPMSRLILNFGQVKTVGHLTGRELRDFNIAGVPLIETLAKLNNVTEEAVSEMVTAGEVTFPMVVEAFQVMTGEGGRFYDLMEKQSQTLGGIISNLQDKFTMFAAAVVGVETSGDIREGSIFFYLKQGADRLVVALDKAMPVVTEFIDTFMKNKEAIVAVAGAIVGLLVVALGAAVVAFGSAIALATAFAAAGAAVAVAALKIKENWEDIKAFFERILKTPLENLQKIKSIVEWLMNIDWSFVKKAPFEVITERFSGRQFGGYVQPSRPYIVGERGPEMFVPAVSGRVEPRISSGRPIELHAHAHIGIFAGTALERRQVAEMLMQEFRELARARGKSVIEEIEGGIG